MLKYTAVIIDDEESNVSLISRFVKKFLINIELIGEAYNVNDGIEIINKLNPQIVFLDIQLNEKTAFDILDQVNFGELEIIFITAYKSFALEAFKYNAIDYILKPFSIEEIILSVNKCIQRIEEKNSFEKRILNFNKDNNNKNDKYVSVSSIDKVTLIKKEDIIFCKSDGRYTTFYLKNNTEVVSSKNLGEYEIILNNDIFFRIHHSYIINIDHVVKIHKKTGYYCEMINKINLPVARRRKDALNKYLGIKASE